MPTFGPDSVRLLPSPPIRPHCAILSRACGRIDAAARTSGTATAALPSLRQRKRQLKQGASCRSRKSKREIAFEELVSKMKEKNGHKSDGKNRIIVIGLDAAEPLLIQKW